MAHYSPSPSGSSSRRRLSELLGVQQEPFYLDLYLLEKGCSPGFLDAAACGGGACSTCWPRARSTGGRLLRRPAARSKRAPRGGGVLRLLLSKILSGATTARAPAAAKKKRPQPAAIEWHRVDDEKQGAPGRSTDATVSSPQRAVEGHHTEVDEEDDEEEEDDESSKKQLSPVSVLEQRLFEHSPPPQAQKAFVLFSELLDAACAPTTLLHLLANARRYKPKDGPRRSTDGGSTPPPTRRARKKNSSHARREPDDDDAPLERDLAAVTTLVASEMPGARVRPEDLRPSAQDVGADIAAAVLEALTEEAAAELLLLLLTDGDGDDGPRPCG
ncbi:uncharacterized protein C2845_PM05G17790 [Panicum miliaceum]|uniref:Uncharacterized protein n=1 Tax=Panicum miliaceum TaxID=4540 RepID=A0A3L6SWJ1_PANMI|nr:uncharacterized protein C2845_PM05G17790 [Panicum miliaceum]